MDLVRVSWCVWCSQVVVVSCEACGTIPSAIVTSSPKKKSVGAKRKLTERYSLVNKFYLTPGLNLAIICLCSATMPIAVQSFVCPWRVFHVFEYVL